MDTTTSPAGMIDPFGRRITYLRISVTDRCDFRCVYCMAEDMTFLPKAQILSLEEIERIAGAFVRLGVRKLRITGGEPLVRSNFMKLFHGLGSHLNGGGLEELTLTTNGGRLDRHAADLFDAGVRRVNVSVDSLDADKFRAITRTGDLTRVLSGIEAAKRAGLRVKINTVAMKGVNDDEFHRLVAWCGAEGFDLTFIETMPMGEVEEDRTEYYLPTSEVRRILEERWTLTPLADTTGGPSRYSRCMETGGRVGFIEPMSHNFCDACNRVRLTVQGTLYMCLGQDDAVDLREPLRRSESDEALVKAIAEAIAAKPKGHDFLIDGPGRPPAVARHMSVTGG